MIYQRNYVRAAKIYSPDKKRQEEAAMSQSRWYRESNRYASATSEDDGEGLDSGQNPQNSVYDPRGSQTSRVLHKVGMTPQLNMDREKLAAST